MKQFSDFGVAPKSKSFSGPKISIEDVLDKRIIVHDYKIEISKFPEKGNGKCLYMQIEFEGKKRVLFSGSGMLMDLIEQIGEDDFPFVTTIIKVKETKAFKFT